MSWDLNIYGNDNQTYTKAVQLQLDALAQELPPFHLPITEPLTIETLLLVEDFLCTYTEEGIEQIHDQLGFVELIHLRSKQHCYAITQLVEYYANGYSWEEPESPQLEPVDAHLLLTKTQLLEILEWLEAVAKRLDPEFYEEKDKVSDISPAAELIASDYCKTEEFEFLHTVPFGEWRQLIIETDFDFYYWENSR